MVGRAQGPGNNRNVVVAANAQSGETNQGEVRPDAAQPHVASGAGTMLPAHDKLLGHGFVSPGTAAAFQSPGVEGPTGAKGQAGVTGAAEVPETPPLELTFDWNRFNPDARAFDRGNAMGLAEISRVVYEDFGPPPADAFKELEKRGFEIKYFSGKPVEIEVPAEKEGDPPVKKMVAGSTQAMLAVRGDTVIVAYRGTEMDSKTDRDTIFEFGKTSTRDGQVHGGFNAGVDQVWDEIHTELVTLRDERRRSNRKAKLEVHLTGHSLGAALSTLSAMRLRKDARKTGIDVASVYTFGSPKVGDARFLSRYIRAGLNAQTHRIDCPKDKIVNLPPDWLGYVHVGEQQSFAKGGHAIAGYCEMLGSSADLTTGVCTPDSVAQSISATVPARDAPQTDVEELFSCFDNMNATDRLHVMRSLEPDTADRILKLKIPDGIDPAVIADLSARQAADDIANTVRDRRFFGTSDRAWLDGANKLMAQSDEARYVIADLLPRETFNRMRAKLEELEQQRMGEQESSIGDAAEILRSTCR